MLNGILYASETGFVRGPVLECGACTLLSPSSNHEIIPNCYLPIRKLLILCIGEFLTESFAFAVGRTDRLVGFQHGDQMRTGAVEVVQSRCFHSERTGIWSRSDDAAIL